MFLLIVVVHGMWMAGEMSVASCSKVFAMLLSVAIGLKLKRRLLRLPASQSGNVFMIINKIIFCCSLFSIHVMLFVCLWVFSMPSSVSVAMSSDQMYVRRHCGMSLNLVSCQMLLKASNRHLPACARRSTHHAM